MERSTSDIYRSTLDALPMSIYVLNTDLRIIWANRQTLEELEPRYRRDLGSRRCHSLIFASEKQCNNCPAFRTMQSGLTESADIRVERKNDEAFYLVTATPLFSGVEGEEPLIVEMRQEFTSHMRADDELRRLHDFNQAIIDNAPVAIFTVNKAGEFSSVNPALAVLSGLGEKAKERLVGFNWLKNPFTIKCGLAQHIKEGLEGKPFQLWDFPFINFWGEPQYIYFTGVPLRGKDGNVEMLLCIIEETTEIVRARAQLVQEAKMSFVGRLAAGIAHELNNPLATITANAELARELIESVDVDALKASDLGELREYINTVEEQAYRCTTTIKSLLEVTRKKDFGTANINFQEFIQELLKVINFRKLKVKLVEEIPGELPEVRGDPEALRQVFLNVISNAIDAVEGTKNAAVWIRAAVKNADTMEVYIEDNGIGIPETALELIFEPFFTTKGPKKGTGLGLTLCYDFLQRMGGKIEVQHRPGGGTTFTISVPVCDQKR